MSFLLQGNGAFTEDGEQWNTVTERENDCWIQYQVLLESADSYHLLVSKDNSLWPHKIQGQAGTRIDVTSMYYAATIEDNTEAAILVGIVTAIDGTDATIRYMAGLPFYKISKEVIISSLRGVPSQVKCDFDGSGVLQHGLTNTVETGVAAVNTVTALPSPGGNVVPGLGDIVTKFDYTGGTISFAIFVFYHNND